MLPYLDGFHSTNTFVVSNLYSLCILDKRLRSFLGILVVGAGKGTSAAIWRRHD